MHPRPQHQPQDVEEEMVLADAELLGSIVAADTTDAGRLDRLAVDDASGWVHLATLRWHPRSHRLALRRSHVPSSRHRRKEWETVCQGGNSRGTSRHGQPVYTTSRMPFTMRRNGHSGGRPRA